MMGGPVARALPIVGLCVALATPPVFGQTDAVDLRLRLKMDDNLFYTIVESSLFRSTLYDVGGRVFTDLDRLDRTIQEEIGVVSVDDDGTLGLDITPRITKTSRVDAPHRLVQSIDVLVRPTGEVVPGVGHAGALESIYYPLGLPDHAVSPGESWTYNEKRVSWDIGKEDLSFLQSEVTFTLTLVGVDRVGGDRVARILIKGEGPFSMYSNERIFAGAVRTAGSATAHVTGEARWSIDGGRLLRLRAETSFEIPLAVEIESRTFHGKTKFTLTEEWALLPGPH